MSRTRKREYTGAKAFDRSCRSHGGCPWCEGNKKFRSKKLRERADDDESHPSPTAEATDSSPVQSEFESPGWDQ